MSTPEDDGRAQAPASADELRAEIESTREQLSATADELANRLNVKHQASAKVDSVKSSIADKTDAIAGKVADVKADAPEPVQHALDKTSETIGPAARQANSAAAAHRKEIAIGVMAAVLVAFLVRRRKART